MPDPQARPPRVLLVDDDALVRGALRTILGAAGVDVVGEAGDGAGVADLARERRPDVVLMDLRMPGVDGVTATARIRALPEPPEVLVLTTWEVDDAVIRSIRAGASGFLLKSTAPGDIVAAVRAVAAGDAVLSPESARAVVERLRADEGADQRRRALELVGRLTDRERAVAERVSLGETNAEIGLALHMSAGTVKQHLSAIVDKLGVTGRVLIAAVMVRAGFGPRW
ncbi:MAG: response regulator transcription factor [Microbacteriaceae bacterium]|nr:response regulator transcription factor [Microbacteriaceae bacterium]